MLEKHWFQSLVPTSGNTNFLSFSRYLSKVFCCLLAKYQEQKVKYNKSQQDVRKAGEFLENMGENATQFLRKEGKSRKQRKDLITE